MSITIKAGATDQTIYFFVADSSSTTGAGLTGLVYNSASLVAYYVTNRGAATQITLATLASATADHSDGGFIEVSASNMPGVYRLDLPDAAVASGNQVIVELKGAADMAPVVKEIFLTAVDMQDAIDLGLTNLDAAITSRMATYTQPTGFLSATFPSGTIANTTNITAGTITTTTNLTNLPSIPANWLTAAGTAADFTTEIQTGLATSSALSTLQTSVDDLPTNAELATALSPIALEATLTDMKGATFDTATDSLEAIRNRGDSAWITATGFSTHSAADAATAVRSELTTELGRIDTTISSRLASASYTAPDNASIMAILEDTGTTIPAAISTLQTSVDALPTAASIAEAVWDEVLTGATHNVPSSAGRRVRQLASVVIHDGTAQGAGTGNNQIQFDNDASATDGAYDPSMVAIVAGTGAGQSRIVLQYAGSTRTATVDRDWRVNPDATSEFIILAHEGREHINEGLAQAGTSTTITLNANASADDDAYNGQLVFIRSGTGQDQVRLITDYNGTTKIATVDDAWVTNPSTQSGYVIIPDHLYTIAQIQNGLATAVALQTVDDNVDAVKAKTDQMTFGATNALNANITYVNEVEVGGTGSSGDEWGPV